MQTRLIIVTIMLYALTHWRVLLVNAWLDSQEMVLLAKVRRDLQEMVLLAKVRKDLQEMHKVLLACKGKKGFTGDGVTCKVRKDLQDILSCNC